MARLVKPQETRCVVIENVALLIGGKKIRRLDRFDCDADSVRPDHLIRTEHDPFSKACIYQASELAVKLFSRRLPIVSRHVYIDLWV